MIASAQKDYVKEALEVRKKQGPTLSEYHVIEDDAETFAKIQTMNFFPEYANAYKIARRKRSILKRELNGYLPPKLAQFFAQNQKYIHP